MDDYRSDGNLEEEDDFGDEDQASEQEDKQSRGTPEAQICCSGCRRVLRVGEDVLSIEEGVLGTRGLVRLEKVLYFCGGKCVGDYFGNEPIERLPRRIP